MDPNSLRILSLPQLTGGADWRLTLAHDRPETLLIWVTRGQGRLLLDGQRRGIGTHNAVLVPARHLFSLDLGRQGTAQVVVIPPTSGLTFPQRPAQLRIRQHDAMGELTALIDAATQEQHKSRPLYHTAMDAHGILMSVWLQRQLALEDHAEPRPNAAARLTAQYACRVTSHFHEAMTMSEHAEALDVTPTHLTRVCKLSTGKTAAELLTERIVYEARHLLAETKVPAQDIARFLGFGSAAYFTRFMLHHTNATPTKLRRQAA